MKYSNNNIYIICDEFIQIKEILEYRSIAILVIDSCINDNFLKFITQ